MIEKKVFGKMQKALKCCKKYCRNATFVADSNGCGVRCSRGELLYHRSVADKQGCANAFCVTEQLPPTKFENDVNVNVRDNGHTVIFSDGDKSAAVVTPYDAGAGIKDTDFCSLPDWNAAPVIEVDATNLKTILEAFDGHVRLEILNPDGKPLSRKLLIYSDSVQGTVKAAIPFYRT
mgnify:FL=1